MEAQSLEQDVQPFLAHLHEETTLLKQWFSEKRFSEHTLQGGFELEFFLVNQALEPVPANLFFVESLKNPSVVPEVGAASLEINTDYYALKDNALEKFMTNINGIWNQCEKHLNHSPLKIIRIGLLPNGTAEDFSKKHLTAKERYQLLNQILKQYRQHHPIEIDINGDEHLRMTTDCLSINGSTGAFHIHMRIGFSNFVRYYNAAQIILAPLLAVSTNSPYLFKKALWEETRIPLFEQVMTVKNNEQFGTIHYATFGFGYLKDSPIELYLDNLQKFPPLYPHTEKAKPECFKHVRLHNGATYRWNRPVIDFNQQGEPHLRIETRALPSGPTSVDAVSNAAFFFGLIYAMATLDSKPEEKISFSDAKQNFYNAAKFGIHANLSWFDQKKMPVNKLILNELLPLAKQGLEKMNFNKKDIDYHLGIIEKRAATQQTGSQWQRAFINKYGHDFKALSKAYLTLQKAGEPVHTWSI